ncbi:MAG: antitoxin [Anaerolinea sp.]|nr:antitoxin [Anaerolinea sp.]
MPRTTIDIDPTVLRELKARGRQEGKTLGRIASELLTSALSTSRPEPVPPFRWTARPMGARIDLEDKEAVRRALDEG